MIHFTPHFNRRAVGLPSLAVLGPELQQASQRQRLLWPLVPLLSLSAFCVLFALRWYPALPVILLAHFIVSVTFAHDVVHGTAGMGRRQAEWVLFGLSLLLIESGHAFRQAHLHHHSHCLEDGDFEGSPARMSLAGALAAGPLYLVRHWQHALRLTKLPVQKRWLILEAASALAMIVLAFYALAWSAGPLVYVGFMWFGSWLYPLTTAWLPHYKPDASPLGQARTLRGRIVPALLCNLSYHLEHHLYPQVPSYNLPQLAQKLDPYFAQLGLVPLRVV